MKIDLKKFELNLGGKVYEWKDLHKIYNSVIEFDDKNIVELMAIKALYPIMCTAEDIVNNTAFNENEAFKLAQKVRFVMQDENITEFEAYEKLGIEI